MEKVRYMISDASSMVNVESHVLRYWEDELELNIPRNEMGHRYYTQENIKEFQYIKELKEKGYQLKAIKMIVHNGDMEQRLPELTGNEADKPGGVKNHQVYFKNPETLEHIGQYGPHGAIHRTHDRYCGQGDRSKQ